jgi:hypothetical protein
MMTMLGSAISAASPWFLLAAPIALGLLVYIFRVRGSSNTTVVSTLFLLKDLPQRPQGRKTFIPPLQFWLELLLFVSLSLAAANLISTKKGRHVAVLLDSSLSMGALASEGTRFEEAKTRATRDIADSSASTSFTVFSGSTHLEKLSSKPTDKTRSVERIESLELSQGKDSLQEQINQLVNDPSYDALWVYTDHPMEPPPQSSRIIVSSSHQKTRTDHNVWIQEVSRSTSPGPEQLLVSVRSTLQKGFAATIKTLCSSRSKSQELPSATVNIEPLQRTTVTITPLPEAWDYCHLTISSPLSTHTESIHIDNEAWVTKDQSLSRVTLQSSLTPDQLGLTKIPLITIASTIKPANPNEPLIIHRQSLNAPPTAASLLVMPPAGPLPWGGSVEESTAITIARWDDSHPIMRYVKPSLLSVPEARVLRCPVSAQPILFSERGPLLCAGESRGVRYAISGIELFPFDGAKTPTLSILLLNTLTWLFSNAGTTSANALPTTVPLPHDTTAVEYVAPSQEPLPITPLKTVTAPHAGVLKVTKATGDFLFFSLNSFYESESDLSLPRPITVTEGSAPPPTATARARELYPWFLSLALIVALADIVRRLRRRQGWGAA